MEIKDKLYMATIWECEDDQTSWMPQDKSWAKGKVTELNASLAWETCESQFYVKPHEGCINEFGGVINWDVELE